jgi:hypothetical protein
MKKHWLAAIGGLIVLLVVSLVSVLVVGGGAANTAVSLRTPWGEPDLQGIWYDETATPLQRPERFAGKELFTDEERAELDRQRGALLRTDRRSAPGSPLDVAGAYNAVFLSVKKTGRRTSLIIDPRDGRIPPMTEEGQERVRADRRGRTSTEELAGAYGTDRMNRADGPEDRGTDERCFGSKLPDVSAFFRLVQSPGYVAIYYEHGQGGGANRVIPVDGSKHLPSHMRLWLGDARGRWEGSTLVVDTTNFTGKTNFRGSRETLHLIERFTRVDASAMSYELTVDDPTTWTRPWTLMVSFIRQSDRANKIFESTCHEGNYGLTGILANTRAAEKTFAEGRGPDPLTTGLALRAADGTDDHEDPLR